MQLEEFTREQSLDCEEPQSFPVSSGAHGGFRTSTPTGPGAQAEHRRSARRRDALHVKNLKSQNPMGTPSPRNPPGKSTPSP